jgi:hypothetical protein
MVRLSAKDKVKKEENIRLAIEHYHNVGETSICASAAKYKVPHTTLRDRLAGARSHQESY